MGLDLGSEWLKFIKLEATEDDFVLQSLGRCPWKPSELASSPAAGKKIQELWSDFFVKEHVAVSSLPGQAAIVKRMTFEAESLKSLGEIISTSAHQYLPFDKKDTYLDYQVISQKEKNFDVLLAACKKTDVQKISEIVEQSGLFLSEVDVDYFALCNSFHYNYQELHNEYVYLLDIGGNQSIFCVCHKGAPLFMRDISFGGNLVTEAIAQIINSSYEDADQIKLNKNCELGEKNLQEVIDSIRKYFKDFSNEIRRLILFYNSSLSDAVSANSIFLSGGGSLIEGLRDFIQSELNIDVQYHDPFRRIFIDEKMFQEEYLQEVGPQMVVAFGLALRAA